jgi:hypothetical protein
MNNCKPKLLLQILVSTILQVEMAQEGQTNESYRLQTFCISFSKPGFAECQEQIN